MLVPKPLNRKIEIDLSSSEGNAFYIIALARKLSNQLGMDFEPIHKLMVGGNYKNLVNIFEKHFGDYVIIYE